MQDTGNNESDTAVSNLRGRETLKMTSAREEGRRRTPTGNEMVDKKRRKLAEQAYMIVAKVAKAGEKGRRNNAEGVRACRRKMAKETTAAQKAEPYFGG